MIVRYRNVLNSVALLRNQCVDVDLYGEGAL